VILIVEDDAIVARTLAQYLELTGFAVEVAGDGASGLERACRPDVELVILDIMIPALNGREVCRRLRARSDVPIMMLTARTSEDDLVTGLELGADDYVPKPFSPREVVARAQALLRRAGTGGGPRVAPVRMGPLEIDLWARQVRLHGGDVPLTATEFRLIEALASRPGRAFTRDELVARACGPDFDGMDRTIDAHITNLRRKLQEGREPRYILTVHGVGYRLAGADGA
jgi:DNA-binding response OmpR family regulator